MAKKNMRKCRICGNEFNVLDNDYVKFKGGFVEVDCYINYKKEKGNVEEVIKVQIEELLRISREEKRIKIEKEKEEFKKKTQAKEREINRKENFSELIKYFSDVYDIKTFPKSTFTKLAQINNGTFKRISIGIPYEDLLDMFKRKKNYLDKVASNNFSQGKGMKGVQRLNYDIAILTNKYDEYLEWKNKQKILSANVIKEEIDKENEIKVDYSKIKNEKSNDIVGIFDIVNDIY